jgi:hypothetical protein
LIRTPQIAAEEGFPRVYRVDERTRKAVNFFTVAVGGLFLAVTALTLTGVLPHRGSLGGLFFTDLTIISILVTLGSFYNKRAILHRDSVEVAGWFYSRKLECTGIRGRQTSANSRLPYAYSYILVPSDPRERKLVLPHYLHTDEFFRNWIKRIPKIPY